MPFTGIIRALAGIAIVGLLLAEHASAAAATQRVTPKVGRTQPELATREPSARRLQRVNPRSQLARYLMENAWLPPKPSAQPELSSVRSLNRQFRDLGIRRGHTVDDLALTEMRRLWTAAGRYFPGREMPTPRFGASETSGAVGWAENPSGEKVPIGINWQRSDSQLLLARNQFDRDQALRALLHEWAHNFQRPELLKERRIIRPLAEGGAEAFAFAAAPLVARASSRFYNRNVTMQDNEYRPFALAVTRQRGMRWILEGQFS